MLNITGNIGNKQYKDEAISAAELAKAFNLPLMGENILKLYKDRVTTDLMGQVRTARSNGFPAEINVSNQNASFTLRYYTNRSPISGGGFNFLPKRISFSGNLSFDANRYDLFVFMCLSPYVTGEFQDRTKMPFYDIFNPEVAIQESKNKADLMTTLLAEVQGMAPEVLSLYAKGVGVPGNTWSEYLINSITMIGKDPEAFEKVWHSDNTTTKGTVMIAIEKSIIEPQNIRGREQWTWGSKAPLDLIGTKICDITNDPQRDILQWLAEPANFDLVIPRLKRMVLGSGQALTQNTPAPANQSAPNPSGPDTTGEEEEVELVNGSELDEFINRLVDTGKFTLSSGTVIQEKTAGPVAIGEAIEGDTLFSYFSRTFTENPDKKRKYFYLLRK